MSYNIGHYLETQLLLPKCSLKSVIKINVYLTDVFLFIADRKPHIGHWQLSKVGV